MKPIRIFTPDLEFQTEIDNYESMVWTRRWHKAGEFELHININKRYTEYLKVDYIVTLDDKAGIISYRGIGVNEGGKGSEDLVIRGMTLASITGQRITVPPIGYAYDKLTASYETIMKAYVTHNCINPADIKRKIPLLELAPDQIRGGQTTHQTRFKQLDEELNKLSLASGLGWDIVLDLVNKKMVFDVFTGKDLTAGQTQNPPVIFSVDFDNIESQQYIESKIGSRTTAYIGGQGEGVDREIVEVGGNVTGLDRIETFVDARDLDEATDLPTRGTQKLAEMQPLLTFENEIMTNGPYEYGKDWDLGDIVTARNEKWKITHDFRITEVTEIYEPSGFRLDATFGTALPTLVDRLRQAVDTPLIEHQDVPTKTSELENDAGFITEASIPDATTYVHTQTAPAAVWTITHNLDRYPSVTVVDSAGTVVIGDVQYQSKDVIQVAFTAPFAGMAYLN